MIENIQHTHKASPLNTAENEEVGSTTTKEWQENSQIEINHQALENKLAFIVGDSMVKDVNGYLLTESLNKKIIVKGRPFLLLKTDYMLDYLKPTTRDFDPNIFALHVGTNNLSTNDSPEMIPEKIG